MIAGRETDRVPKIRDREIADVQLRARPSMITTHVDPSSCDHAWEPHMWERGRAYCGRCGSYARWTDDPRQEDDL